MQWVLDIWLDWLYANGIYRCRYYWLGDDFDETDFTTDGNRHTLDLSSIVPANVKAVNLSCIVLTPTPNSIVRFLHPDSTTHLGRCIMRTQVANIQMRTMTAIGVDSNRHVDYTFSNVTWTSIGVNIRGWWF